mgnify:FL=1
MINTIVNVVTGETTIVDDGIDYVAPAPTAQDVRSERDSKLQSEVDVIAGNALRWAALSSDKQAEWATYRTALLDVPQQSGFPDVTWPTAPE